VRRRVCIPVATANDNGVGPNVTSLEAKVVANEFALRVMDFGDMARDAVVVAHLTIRSASEVIMEAAHMRLELGEDDRL